MFFGDIFTLLLQSILFWTSRKEIKLIQYKMDQKILWAVNKMPKTDDKNLPIMGLEEIKKARFDVTEALGRTLLTFEQKIEEKHLDVQVDMPEKAVYVMANEDAITQVIYNLIDNGVKFAKDGTPFLLTVATSGGKALVSVANYGPTIPPEELPLVFDRFHKSDKSRSMDKTGVGLGLYIVKTILGSHGEDISVTSRDGKTEFTFTLTEVNSL